MQPRTLQPSTEARQPSYKVPLVVVVVQLCWMVGFPLLNPGSTIQYPFFVYGAVPIAGTLTLLGWFLSRTPRTRSYQVAVLSIFGSLVLSQAILLDPSVNLVRVFVFQPIISSVLVVTMFAVRHQTSKVRLGTVVGVLTVVVAFSCTLRMQGMTGGLIPQFVWRWRPTTEPPPRLDRRGHDNAREVSLPAGPDDDDWPAFRGPNRDSVVRRPRLILDWGEFPPKELWRTPIGSGWSSFCVVGDCAFTQEQHGSDELISCRRVTTGEVLWSHAVAGRFEDSSSGPGPRSTPGYADGRLYALTATGILIGLDAFTGSSLWQTDLKQLFGLDVPPWGFASSPLVVQDDVIVFTGAGEGKSVAAFDRVSGALRWNSGNGGHSYSSAHWVSMQGQPQILVASNQGIDSLDPASGTRLWQHEWDIGFSPRIVQPCVLPGDALLLATAYGKGTRRLQVEQKDGRWTTEAIWTSRKLRPYFNDLVYHDGFVYGFNGSILTCLDASSGEPSWRKRGFGNGQVLLLQPQSVLLVLSEQGAVSLIEASENDGKVLAQFQALNGKTWNHPVISGSHLLVRNGFEAACYKLMLAEPEVTAQP
ncbi:MAG: PQQ-binding-like beta-propeller repeat protein [Planctomycetota bacterium]